MSICIVGRNEEAILKHAELFASKWSTDREACNNYLEGIMSILDLNDKCSSDLYTGIRAILMPDTELELQGVDDEDSFTKARCEFCSY